jgi:hypothetical protein
MACRQGRHAGTGRHRKGLCWTVPGWRHLAERGRSRIQSGHSGSSSGPAPGSANRDRSSASPCAAKTRTHHNRGYYSGSAISGTWSKWKPRGRTVCGRSFRQRPLPDGYGGVGEFAVESLSLRLNEELRHHETRRIHVREGSDRR